MIRRPTRSTCTYTLCPYTTLFRSRCCSRTARECSAGRTSCWQRPSGRSERPADPPTAFVGAAEAASSCALPCEGRGGLGRGVFRISANRGHPLPASPCLRRGRGQGKGSRLPPLLQVSPAGSGLFGRVLLHPLPALFRRHRVPLLAQFATVFLRHAAHLVEQRACLFPLFGVHVPPALHAAVRALALFRGHVLPACRVPVTSPALSWGVVSVRAQWGGAL